MSASEKAYPRCVRCLGECKPGTAYQNELQSFNEFSDVKYKRGATMSYTGPARLVAVWKCTKCGHSFSRG